VGQTKKKKESRRNPKDAKKKKSSTDTGRKGCLWGGVSQGGSRIFYPAARNQNYKGGKKKEKRGAGSPPVQKSTKRGSGGQQTDVIELGLEKWGQTSSRPKKNRLISVGGEKFSSPQGRGKPEGEEKWFCGSTNAKVQEQENANVLKGGGERGGNTCREEWEKSPK